MKRTPEPYLWLLFSGGGVVAALVLPVLVLLFGVLMPLGVVDWPAVEHLRALLDNLVVRLALIVVVTLCLFHAAHRIRFTSEELFGIAKFDRALAVICYGAALAGVGVALWMMV
ncbi:fumarate reductase subunit D [Nonomuraea sp. KC401]|uniref:Fumarate reductase subunit D n=1 Tax=Nonomuraea longispora TaxID=1848320 RepID=A0A4V2XHT5_9ACTN|nr:MULTISPECIES: fumarate reductase subunit FrdD [Nonomuraea]NBE98513.1 fumarate reductase subunit D [Nonomuraea sp. K271]TDB96145.1 fumarate reductase subunit D [Nonomuraea longispora]TLF59642.1 fumarate reductase subunit D [Nonomuraea sp. KC401]